MYITNSNMVLAIIRAGKVTASMKEDVTVQKQSTRWEMERIESRREEEESLKAQWISSNFL